MKLIVLTLLLWGHCGLLILKAQITIWSENFDQYQNGDTLANNLNSGNPADDWEIGGCTACPDSVGDWWEVRDQRLAAHDVNEAVYFQSELIDISAFQQVSFELDIVEMGDLEGPYFGSDDCVDQDNQDFVNVSYRLDNGLWQLIPNYLSWCSLYDACQHTLYGDDGVSGDCRITDDDWDSVRVAVGGLNGHTLELRVELINSADDEFIMLDNLEVRGQLILPVEIINLNAQPRSGNIEITWSTLSETNSHRFYLYRSISLNDSPWLLSDSVNAAGLSNSKVDYRIIDSDPAPGVNYYRLQQVDFDGQEQWSEIVKSVPVASFAKLYPTVAFNAPVYLESPIHDPLQLSESLVLMDLWGRQHPLKISKESSNLWVISLFDLPHGLYRVYSLSGAFDPLEIIWHP
jgi:hypothetical protein